MHCLIFTKIIIHVTVIQRLHSYYYNYYCHASTDMSYNFLVPIMKKSNDRKLYKYSSRQIQFLP